MQERLLRRSFGQIPPFASVSRWPRAACWARRGIQGVDGARAADDAA